MEGGLRGGSRFGNYEHDEINGSRTPEPESLVESSPSTGAFSDVMKLPSTSSPKRSRRSLQKRVVSIPIKDSEGSRLKGEGAPPSDSWAWRKYGQKPIKGSPYPRGYYRCSSSKGCPARKQVERSRDDPTMLVITYSNEHNHPWPAPRNNHHHHHHNHHSPNQSTAASDTSSAAAEASPIEEKPEVAMGTPDLEPEPEPEPEPEHEEKFTDMGTHEPSPLLPPPSHIDEFSWFADMQTTSSALLERPFFAESSCNNIAARDADVAMFFPMREEDESLFADLGELPECSVIFRHRDMGTQVQIC